MSTPPPKNTIFFLSDNHACDYLGAYGQPARAHTQPRRPSRARGAL